MQREKGAAAERDVAARLRPLFPEVRRRCTGEESQGRRGADLEGTPGFCFQVKCDASPRPLAALAEAAAAAREGEIPAAIVRQSRRGASTGWCVTVSFDHFLLMARELGEFDADSLRILLAEIRSEPAA